MVESSALFLHLSLSDPELDSGDSDLDWIPGTFLFKRKKKMEWNSYQLVQINHWTEARVPVVTLLVHNGIGGALNY